MLFESLSWVMFALTLLVALPGALASSSPKKTKKSHAILETYSALEEDDIGDVPTPHYRRVQTLGSPAPIGLSSSVRVAILYDTVPSGKRRQVLERMHLCETLFEETGRAYDYRTMTTAALESELSAVRVAETPSTPERDPILDVQE